MLNAGSTPLPYEPYTGGKPSPSPEYPQPITNAGASGSIETIITGKNLLTGRLYYGRYNLGQAYIQNEDAVSLPYVPAFENSGICYAVSIRKGITYTFSVTNGNTNARLFLALYRTFEDAFNSANAISKVEDEPSASITASEDGILVCLIAGVWTNGSTTIHECTESELLQLEIGSTATAYEAPHSQSIAVTTPNGLPGIPVDSGGNFVDETGQEWICNYRDWARGVDVKHCNAVTLFGTESSHIFETYFYLNYTTPLALPSDLNVGLCTFCQYGIYASDKIGINSIGTSVVYNPNGKYTLDDNGLEDWKSYLAEQVDKGTPSIVVYAIKTPIETPIPADELAAYRALHTYDGTTTISSPDPLAEIEFNYTTSNQTNLPYIKNKGDSVSGTYDFTLAELNVAEPVEDSNPVTKGYLDGKIDGEITQKIKYYISYDENGMISLMTDDITKTI